MPVPQVCGSCVAIVAYLDFLFPHPDSMTDGTDVKGDAPKLHLLVRQQIFNECKYVTDILHFTDIQPSPSAFLTFFCTKPGFY